MKRGDLHVGCGWAEPELAAGTWISTSFVLLWEKECWGEQQRQTKGWKFRSRT